MFSLSDAAELESLGEKAASRFRPWWEVLNSYCLNGLLMAVLFALAGVTISGTYNIWCFPLGNDTNLDSASLYYANSRCSRIFDGSYLIYFPYLMFLEWTVLFAVHLLWFKLPATLFLFQQLAEVFSEFSSVKPVEYNTEKRRSKGIIGLSSKLTGLQLKEDKDTRERIRYLVDRLMEIMQRNNRLLFNYTIKAIFLSLANIIVVIILSHWLSVRQWHASFPCDMSAHIPAHYKDMTCSLPAAPFLYGLMISNVILAFCICLCNLRAIFWVFTFKTITYSHYREALGKWAFLVDKSGFDDFCFCLSLTSLTSKDGVILGDIIYSSLKLYHKMEKHIHTGLMPEISEKSRFASSFYQGQTIADNLGLKVLELKISDDSLFHALASTVGKTKHAVCQEIAEELVTNISVYKDLVDNDLNCPVFEECVELIQVENKCPKEFQHYALMSASNALAMNIVVLRATTKSWYYKSADGEKNEVPTKYLLFVPPNHYQATEDDSSVKGKQEQQLFISDPLYRRELQAKALESWQENGAETYKAMVKALNPKIISYGQSAIPDVKRPRNVLSDLFYEMGHKISGQILTKIYIPSLQKQDPVTNAETDIL